MLFFSPIACKEIDLHGFLTKTNWGLTLYLDSRHKWKTEIGNTNPVAYMIRPVLYDRLGK